MQGIKFLIEDRAGFHIGDANGDLKEIFSSDQFFSAIINNAALLYSDDTVEEIINLFEIGDFSISSLFYGLDFIITSEEADIKKSLYFLPKPNIKIRSKVDSDDEIWVHKKIKKISYLSLGAYQKLLDNWNPKEEMFNYNLLDLIVIGNQFACTKEEIADLGLIGSKINDFKFIQKSSRPKLTVDRFNSEAKNFYYQNDMELIYTEIDDYQIKPFMFFLYEGDLKKELKAIFRLLVEEGIGGKRSRGMGHFEEIVAIGENELKGLSRAGNYYVNLSTLFPQKEEVENMISYQLAKRSGYLYSQGGQPYRKKSVRVMTEGSVLLQKIEGQLKDVTPDSFKQHNVLLNGKSFLIGFGGDR
ncbi:MULTISPECIES: type III-A CRISPR-associated RAMP protein Csm4 [unclassified Candidatus Frackibacter]|uniref:type III-A CRISPR-associated RAMP protein Csm4 n=1 Tax=unclassified Candidatus Frackibacter TaxID=2648818 RepID=UPI00089123C0|nr:MULTISPECIES: type III-A CRISPR-associated RAMP protein Csm4 [unclassified Candidatus Frackibacter]SDC25852.1 CRISPR-associated protein, Csm4 family [Candidatus Frackibacter sp. WG11]SEM52834.1 CRISPR-associated protein, Csm4 family [Candidatus Frackibacter sp. WG12]SFL55586.1 CRISPR-associated protein, Csm4 family [Candidatus Frackibacter sp. WG13]